MSVQTLQQVITRIKGATKDSQIAVFRCDNHGKLNAVFESTVMTRQMIKQNSQDLIGVYHDGMNMDSVSLELRSH